MSRRVSGLVCIGAVLSCLTASQAAVVFVDGRVSTCGDGQTWATAYKYLQDALTAARTPGSGITEIWVAAGTYQPDRDCTHPTGTGDRTATFHPLVDGVALRGGFAGTEDPATFDLATRDFTTNKTTLSGDLAGDDGPNFANNGENGYHVIVDDVVGPTAALDGFTIAGGNANGITPGNEFVFGGGVYAVNDSNPTLTHCTFNGNWAHFGGGMISTGNPTLTDCTFNGNLASLSYGGGMYSWGGNPVLTRCAFIGNSVGQGSGSGAGGGMRNTYGSPILIDCTFFGNSAGEPGSALDNRRGNLTLINCTVAGNLYTGAFEYYPGHAIRSDYGSQTLTNCILWGNSGIQIYLTSGATAEVTYSCVQGGWLGTGNISADPLFVNAATGDLRLQAGSPCIDAGNNVAVPSGVLTDLDGHFRFFDDPTTPDTGNGTPPIVDMGAYEYIPIIPGDFDRDGDVDHADFEVFSGCRSGPQVAHNGSPNCLKANFDGDTDVDQSDFGIFQRCYSGQNVPADPNCAN